MNHSLFVYVTFWISYQFAYINQAPRVVLQVDTDAEIDKVVDGIA